MMRGGQAALALVAMAGSALSSTVAAEGNSTYGVQSAFRGGAGWAEALQALLPPTDGVSELDVIEKQLAWKHDLVLWVLPPHVRAALPELVQSWLVNMFFGLTLYLALGALWACAIYVLFKDTKYGIASGNIPARADLWAQCRVSLEAIPLYTLLPPMSEALIRSGRTLAYGRVEAVGLPLYGAYLLLYMASVEFGVYWMHRKLHEVRLGYKLLHATHHTYNKESTLSPFAGLAFHPLDGILQAIPYVWTLSLVPMHFLTHELLLFATAVWTTSIHDCVYGGGEPIMGAGYHLIHHTSYKHNYGHYLTLCDWAFGTLKRPPAYAAAAAAAKAQ